MTTDTTYNGWTNYATWSVNLEMFDGINPIDMEWPTDDVWKLSHVLQNFAEEMVCPYGNKIEHTLAESYALAFLAQVNWREIARNLISAYKEFA